MTPPELPVERLRLDPANWKLGCIYYCREDPRVVVRQRLPVGWAWNFAHPRVVPALALTVLLFLAPPVVAWRLGLRSFLGMSLVVVASLCVVMIMASRLSRARE